jgi:hypothetical protein
MTAPGGTAWLEIGDPSFIGWFTSAGYLLAAIFAVRAYHLHRSAYSAADLQRRIAIWWLGVAVLLIMLGLNKELDLLQKLVREWGRILVVHQGWYDQRRTIQGAFLLVLLLLCTCGAAAAQRYFHRVWPRIARSAVGVTLILSYALLRAMQFNVSAAPVPRLLASLAWVLETGGVLVVLWCAIRAARLRT